MDMWIGLILFITTMKNNKLKLNKFNSNKHGPFLVQLPLGDSEESSLLFSFTFLEKAITKIAGFGAVLLCLIQGKKTLKKRNPDFSKGNTRAMKI